MRPPRFKIPFNKQVVPAEEWEAIKDNAAAAQELLDDPRFAFFRDYLANTQKSVTEHFVTNKIRTVQEHLKISDVLTKTFTTTKAEQEQELSGQYKLVDAILADLALSASLPKEYLEAQKAGKIEIEGAKEESA